MEIKISLNEHNDQLTLTLLPCPSNFLFSIFKEIEIKKIEQIHICIFDENEDNDTFINNTNLVDIIGEINTVNSIGNYLQQYNIDAYTINKLIFQTENISIIYDDDALLVLKITMENVDKMLNYAQSVIKQYVSTIANVENIDLLYD
ncbi:MAG: hypothetical protein LBN95_02385 [Prevotellaceae bacterium]|jgi:hypothetical protein|nr:hypothetical protein [Prevotellaceae bacterium]